MAEMLPSCLKPKDKGKLGGLRTASTEQKAARYRELRPGVPVSDEKAAERVDLMRFRDDNGIISKRRKTTVGSFRVPADASIWDDDGNMKP